MYKFYSTSITTVGDDEDLFDTINSNLGITALARGFELVSANNIGVDISYSGVYSTLFQDADAKYRLRLMNGEVITSSIKIETTGHTVWVAILY